MPVHAWIMGLDDPGDIQASPGSVPRARALRLDLRDLLHQRFRSVQYVLGALQAFDRERDYAVLEDSQGQPFTSLIAFCTAPAPYGLGWDEADVLALWHETREMALGEFLTEQETKKQLVAEPHPKEGRPEKLDNLSSLTQKQRAEANGVGIVTQKKLDHLAGHREDLLHEVQIGTMSVDKAYRLAKGQVPETPFDGLLRAWRRVSREDRVRFVREMLTEEERAELAEELLAIETRTS